MHVKGLNIYDVPYGDSIDITFNLVDETDGVFNLEDGDVVIWRLPPFFKRKFEGLTTPEFTVSLTKDEMLKLQPGTYKYDIAIINGASRTTLMRPAYLRVIRRAE